MMALLVTLGSMHVQSCAAQIPMYGTCMHIGWQLLFCVKHSLLDDPELPMCLMCAVRLICRASSSELACCDLYPVQIA